MKAETLPPAVTDRLEYSQVVARKSKQGRVLVVCIAAVAMAAGACSSDDDPVDGTSTCDLLPLQRVATALALPGQNADDLTLTGNEYDPTFNGTRPDGDESGPLLNECLAGDPSVATFRVTALTQDTPPGTARDVVGGNCTDFATFPTSVDAIGGTCLEISTEARGRWGDQRIVVQLYWVSGREEADRTAATDIADEFAAAINSLS